MCHPTPLFTLVFLKLFLDLPLLAFSQEGRTTESGEQCIFPFSYNGKNFSDCLFSKENNKEWCFTSKDYKTWGFCKQASEKKIDIKSEKKQELIMIRNMLPSRRESLCLIRSTQSEEASSFNTSVLAVPCLETGKNTDDFLWKWSSPGLIKTSDETFYLCSGGAKASEKENSTLGLCKSETSDESESDAVWYFDENGKMVNIKTGACIVVDKTPDTGSDVPDSRAIFEGNCYENEYENREIWIKNTFSESEREKTELKLEINHWRANHHFLKDQLARNQNIKQRISNLSQIKQTLHEKIADIKELIKQKLEKIQFLKNLKTNAFHVNTSFFKNQAQTKGVNFTVFPNVALLPSEDGEASFVHSKFSFPPEKPLEEGIQNFLNKPFSGRFSSFFLSQPSDTYYVRINKSEGLGLKLMINNKIVFDFWSKPLPNKFTNLQFQLTKGDMHEVTGEFFSTQPHDASFQISLDSTEGKFDIESLLFLSREALCYPENDWESYINCPASHLHGENLNCVKFFKAGLLHSEGGRLQFSKSSNFSIENLQEIRPIGFDGFIKEVRFKEKKNYSDGASKQGWYSFFGDDLEYFKGSTPLGAISEIELSCSKAEEDKAGSSPIINKEYGFRLYLKRPKEGEMPGRYYKDIFFTVIPLREERPSYQDKFGDVLLKSSDWSRSSCKGEYFIINLYKLSFSSQSEKFKRRVDYLPTCNDTFSLIDEWLSTKDAYKKHKIDLVLKCPKNCKTKGVKGSVFGTGIYHSDSSICLAAIHAGMIVDHAGGDFVLFHERFSEGLNFLPSLQNGNSKLLAIFSLGVFSKELISKEKGTFFYLEANSGRECIHPYLLSREAEHLNFKPFNSFLQLDEKINGMNRESLVPSELISKMTSIINQNTEMIMKQNLNIKEVKEENARITQKLADLEAGESGFKELQRKLQNYSQQLEKLNELIADLDSLEEKHIKDFNERVQTASMKQPSGKSNSLLIPSKDQELSFEWQIIDAPSENVSPSRWAWSACSLTDEDAGTEQCLWQSSPFLHNIEAQQKPSSLLLYKTPLNQLSRERNFLFSSDFFFKGFCAFGFALNYLDYENFDELLIEKTEYSSQVHFIQVRANVAIKHHSNKICAGRQQSHEPVREKCLELAFNQLHNLTVIYYNSNLILKINGAEIGVFEVEQNSGSFKDEGLRTFGLISHSGNTAFFQTIRLEPINIPEEAQSLLFGKMRQFGSENKGIEAESDSTARSRMGPEEEEKNPVAEFAVQEKSKESSMRFKQKLATSNEIHQETGSSAQPEEIPPDSIENIKVTCIRFKGSTGSCTQALIAFDEYLSNSRGKEPNEEEIARVVYTKCLRFAGASPLACSSAYKKAIEVNLSF